MSLVSRFLVASFVLAASTLAASLAEAVPPLPQTRIDAVDRKAVETSRVLLAGILDGITVPLNWNGNELGYYARTVHGLGEVVRGEREKKSRKPTHAIREKDPRFADLPIFPDPLERPLVGNGQGRPENPPGRPENPGQSDNPPGHTDSPGRSNEATDVREPSGAALLVIGMAGLFLAARRRPS
jgi:hypothetical protein